MCWLPAFQTKILLFLQIKAALLMWLQRDCNDPQVALPAFLRNKLAQTLVSVLQLEYPQDWPTFFQDLIRALGQGEGLIDMFCRILVSVDEDLVSLDIPRCGKYRTRGGASVWCVLQGAHTSRRVM